MSFSGVGGIIAASRKRHLRVPVIIGDLQSAQALSLTQTKRLSKTIAIQSGQSFIVSHTGLVVPKTITQSQTETISFAASVALDIATKTWINSVSANGGTVSISRASTVDTFIRGLKTDSLFTKFDRLYLLAAENSIAGRTDLISGALATFSGPTPSFQTDRGFTGTGANGSIVTGFNQASGSPQATQNSTHFSLWSNTNPLPTGATGEYCGADPGGGGTYWLYFTSDLKFYFRTNDNGAATALASSYSSHQGHFISSRNSSTTRRVYYNGTLHDTTSVTSAAVPNTQHLIISSGFTHQVSAYSVGSNMDAGSDASNFYSRLRTYMTAVGVP